MVFAEASSERLQAQVMIDEAILASSELLDILDPVELRHWFERLSDVYLTSGPVSYTHLTLPTILLV